MVQVFDDFLKLPEIFALFTVDNTVEFILKFLHIIHRFNSIEFIRNIDVPIKCASRKILLSLTYISLVDFVIQGFRIVQGLNFIHVELEI